MSLEGTSRCSFVACPMTEALRCTVCREVLDGPVSLPCFHVFCARCIKDWLDAEQNKRTCPVCRATIPRNFVLSRNFVIDSCLDELIVKCSSTDSVEGEPPACTWEGPRKERARHAIEKHGEVAGRTVPRTDVKEPLATETASVSMIVHLASVEDILGEREGLLARTNHYRDRDWECRCKFWRRVCCTMTILLAFIFVAAWLISAGSGPDDHGRG